MPRPIIIHGDVAFVPLTQGKMAVIDASQAELVGRWSWYAENPYGDLWYAARKPGSKSKVFLHRLLLGAKPGDEVDHADGDGLNCRLGNMRFASSQENNRNRRAKKRDLPKGVHEFSDGFIAMIWLDKKAYQVGRLYETPEEATAVYQTFAKALHGDFYRYE